MPIEQQQPGTQHLQRHTSMRNNPSLSFNNQHAVPAVEVENCVPVFEVGYWMNFGGFASVRQQHEKYSSQTEVLSIWNLPVESAYGADITACLKLGWPQCTHVSLEYSTWEPEPNKYSVLWHKLLCDSSEHFFPRLIDYRVWQMLPARLEVFSIHKLKAIHERNLATDIIAQVPDLLSPNQAVQQFYEHRCRYLEHVVMSMDSVNKAETYTKYKYLTLALATPVLAPRTLTIVNCRLKHMRAILNCIDRNALGLPTTPLEYQPGALELGKGLQHLHLKMSSLYDELTGLPVSASRFPELTSLIIEHSPALDNTLSAGEKFGQLWETRWPQMKRLQLPFFSDMHAALLIKFMPQLEILAVIPAPGFEAGNEYPGPLSAETLVKLATQMQTLRHLEIRSMLRFRGKRTPNNLADQVSLALKRPPMTLRPELKLFAVPHIHMDLVSVLRLLQFLPGVEQLEFQLPDSHAFPANNAPSKPAEPPQTGAAMSPLDVNRLNSANVSHNLEGFGWAETKQSFFASQRHPLQSIIISGYHPDLHSPVITEFLSLFPDLESLAFTQLGREDRDNIDQLAGVLTALNPQLSVAII